MKKRFTKDRCTVQRVCGIYVDANKNKQASMNAQFLNLDEDVMFGTVHRSVYGSNCAWCVNSEGIIFNNQRQQFNLIVAPAFNLNLSKIEIIGNEIFKKSK